MRKQIRISPEVHAKILEHLEKRESRVLLKSWVEKACLDLIKKEEGEGLDIIRGIVNQVVEIGDRKEEV